MSDSVRPHIQQSTRLLCPWDSPGKNTGVGCHFLLQCVKVKSQREVAQSCLTPSNPMDCSPTGSSVHGIFQARVLEWGAIAFSRGKTHFNAKPFRLNVNLKVKQIKCFIHHENVNVLFFSISNDIVSNIHSKKGQNDLKSKIHLLSRNFSTIPSKNNKSSSRKISQK